VTTGGAGGFDREIGPPHAELDGDLAGSHIRDNARDEERADSAGTLFQKHLVIVLKHGKPSEPGSRQAPHAMPIVVVDLET